jgi:hypothetical protein
MLPDGVVARMQLSPYRVQLAGIRTAPAAFLPLEREIETSGVVARDQSSAEMLVEIPARQAPWVEPGVPAAVSVADLHGQAALSGRVKTLTRETASGWEYLRLAITIADPPSDLRSGMIATVRVKTPMATLGPFRTLPSDPPRLETGEPRQVYVCPDHPDSIGLASSLCPIDKFERELRQLTEQQRLRWWCPVHPQIMAKHAGLDCPECGGMSLQPRLVSFNPAGQVLAVPQSAVVDTGARKVVFVERMPGMFDGIEVVLGPRCGDYYPVVKGLDAGQRVAIAGAFLLDAETRLNPSLAAGYFGAGRGQRASSAEAPVTEPSPDRASTVFRSLSAEDRKLAERQNLCPVTNKPLGSMGAPARVVVEGRVVFLCCDGCEDALRSQPAKHLAKLSGLSTP